MKIYRLNDEECLISDRLNKKVGTKTDWLREEDLKSADKSPSSLFKCWKK